MPGALAGAQGGVALAADQWSLVLLFAVLAFALGLGLALFWRFRQRSELARQLAAMAQLRASEERYRTLVDTLDVCICRWLPDTTLIFTNERYRHDFGLDEAQARQPWINLLPEPLRAPAAAFYEELAANPRTLTYERPETLADGSVHYFQWIDTPILDASGTVVEFQSVGVDLTERKRAEELVSAQRDLARISNTLSTSEAVWPLCFDVLLRISGMDCGGIYLFGEDEAALELIYHRGLSERFLAEAGRYPADAANVALIKADIPVYLGADEIARAAPLSAEGLTAIAVIPIQSQGRVLGSVNVASRSLAQVPAHGRAALETIAAEIGNLVVYLRTAAALHAREAQTRDLVSSLEAEQLRFAKVAATLPGAICTFRLKDGRLSVPYGSKAFEEVFGLGLDELAETLDPINARVPPEQLGMLYEGVSASAATLEPWRMEYQYRHPLKGDIWLEGFSMPIREEDGSTLWHGITIDITERKQIEEQLRLSEVRFRALIEHAPGAITLVNAEGRLIFISTSTERVMGYDPVAMLGQDPSSLTHPDDLPGLVALLAELIAAPGQVRTTQYRFLHRNGSWRWVESTVSNLLYEPSVGALAFNFQDITERKQAELALRASEEQYRGLMESLDSMVSAVDAEGSFLYLNDNAARALGGAPRDFIGRSMHGLFPAPVADAQLRNIRTVIAQDAGLVNEAQSMVRGRPRWFRTSIQPIHDETGRAIYALVNSTDIHDLKVAQQELLELNRTLEERVRQGTAEVQDLYERAPTGYHSLDASGNIIRVNQTELDWLGYTREELIGCRMIDLLTPASRALFEADFPLFKERGWMPGIELELIRKDGSSFPALISATAVYDEAGGYLMSRSTLFDITQRKAAEAALRESEAQNRLLFEESPDALVLFDELGAVARMNHAFELMTGYDREQLLGQALDERGLVDGEDRLRLVEAIEQAHHSDNFAAIEFRLNSVAGQTLDIGARIFGLPIQGAQHYLAALRDITAEKQAAAALRHANSELARAARAKDEFLATMSHELRTPLNAILAFCENLQEEIYGALTPRQGDALRHIGASGQHLLALINDILDLSKVEAGRLDIQPHPVQIADICQSSLLFVKEAALKKGLRLSLHLQNHVLVVNADPRRLKQMLVNLLSNAVKFTPQGGTVRLEVSADGEAVRFLVEDTGIGIAPQDLARLFQPFSQVDTSLSRQHEGTGLGLALVRRLAELHGGSITVASEPGQGSSFTIALPYTPPVAPPAEAPAEARLARGAGPAEEAAVAGVRVLVAEDNAASAQVISDYLGARGYVVAVARNGQEALDLAGELRPELILMDIQMPELDGLAAIRRLRASPGTARTPIIALTALAMPGDRERCLEAGANDYLTKPVSLKGLVEVMQRLRLGDG